MMEAVQGNGAYARYAGTSMLSDREFVHLAMSRPGGQCIYSRLANEFKTDRELARMALSNDGYLFRQLPQNLREDRELVMHAIENSPRGILIQDLRCLHTPFRDD